LRRKSIGDELRSLLVGNNSETFTAARYTPLAQQGYRNNEVVYFIISDIARSAASVKLLDGELSAPVKQLIDRPEQGKAWKTWIYEQMIYRLIGGASYAQIVRIGSRVSELPVIRPDRIQPVTGSNGIKDDVLIHWLITQEAAAELLPEDVFFSKLLDPLDEWRGWSPLMATRANVDNRNTLSELQRDILENDGAPFGILNVKQPADGLSAQLTQEQLDDVQEKVNRRFKDNKGKVPVVDWEFHFERIGQTGRELDFSKSDEGFARKTAMAFGYPPALLGFADGSTFNNMREAKEFLWTNTIIPHLDQVLCDLSFLLGETIKPNIEVIPALADLMARKREAARKDFEAGIISVEEAREEGGYPEEVNGVLMQDPNKLPIGMQIPELPENVR